jgi:hypothetical protein
MHSDAGYHERMILNDGVCSIPGIGDPQGIDILFVGTTVNIESFCNRIYYVYDSLVVAVAFTDRNVYFE